MNNTKYLVLENGKIFKGMGFAADGEAMGEIVFTTAMTGYNETITDPSYCGQIVVQTFPLIGNYGVMSEDFESDKPYLKAYIVKDICKTPSNFRCEGDLESYLTNNGVIGLCGIDTRQLTKILREKGTMNGMITSDISDIDAICEKLKNHSQPEPVALVSSKEVKSFKAEDAFCDVVLWDFGSKDNIRRELLNRGCNVTVVPHSTTASEICALNPDGIMLSNGPGDPTENAGVIRELAELKEKNIPTFGICLGHQLLALANGAKSQKLKYGHRGENQPVKDVKTGRIYISSQNHGYAIESDSLPENASVSFYNVNDGTCEGIDYADKSAFSVQFHPEACGGPHDTEFLFDRFIELIKGGMTNAAQ